MKENYLDEVDGKIPSKHYMVTLIDKTTRSIQEILDVKDLLTDLDVKMKKNDLMLRINPLTPLEA